MDSTKQPQPDVRLKDFLAQTTALEVFRWFLDCGVKPPALWRDRAMEECAGLLGLSEGGLASGMTVRQLREVVGALETVLGHAESALELMEVREKFRQGKIRLYGTSTVKHRFTDLVSLV
jgi:hypothetical protein